MADEILILRGPERVRRRPAVIFGSNGIEGVMAAVEMLINIVAEDSATGFSDLMEITQYRDGSIGIQDNGRGIFLGTEDVPLWRELFCQLYAGSAYGAPQKQRSIFEAPCGENAELDDHLELCAVQYASEYMDVCVHRDGLEHKLHFEKGENIGGLTRNPSAGSSGTYIRFKPDAAVFTDIALPTQWLSEKANALAILISGVKVIFRKESAEGFAETTFCYPAGIADYLQAQSQNCAASAPYTAELTAEGQERYDRPRYSARVTIGLCFTEKPGFIKCYHNQKTLTYGGTHLDMLIDEVAKYLGWMLECNVRKEDLLTHLQLVVITESDITAWSNGTRTSIENTLIRDMAQDTIGENFRSYVKKNQDFLSRLFCR